ncbi:ankyrin repeat domain-containing protein [Paenibacillus herberti]|uniref:Uncharacterized protein n=1 Tax=Paenibacillus herberti TaxID=1619309 RepID=A0A229P0D6_9BACL|nr:hypothetical protein CGZ75_02885 [Paenibacillus herberti]
MRIGLIIALACTLFLQGCSSENRISSQNEGGETATMDQQLLQAAERKDAATLEKLIKDGANINAQDSKGRTAAMIATYNNDIASAKVILEAGADVNIQDEMKNTPFLYAGAEGNLEILKLTIAAGADPTITNRYNGTALIPASEHGYTGVVQELLTNTKIDVNHVNRLGWTALMEAIVLNNGNANQQETVRLLIQHGADVNLPDEEGVTPLKHARQRGFDEIVQLLVQAGAK